MTETASFPVIEVSHLPSASSFYASVLQPLGLQYLSTAQSANRTRLLFGHHHSPTSKPITIFALTQAAPSTPPQPTFIRLAAPSPSTVDSFYRKALLANSAQRDPFFERSSDQDSRAKIQDLDGNMVEAIYSSRAGRRVPTIETASTEKEARRVLAWQEEVARSTAASDHASAVGPDDYDEPPRQYRRAETFPRMVAETPRLVKRETVTTEHYRDERERAAVEARGGGAGSGFTGMKLMGTLLGAAAGAALAYQMVRSESPPRVAPPPRRASYGDHGSQYMYTRPVETVRTTVERVPIQSYVSTKEPPRYKEYRIAPPPAPSAALAQDISRIEERSHVSRRSRDSERGSRVRSRSELGSQRPLTILPPRARSPGSHVSHRSQGHKSSHSHSKRDVESYVSARSHRSESTIKPAQPVQYVTAPPSKATTTTIRVVPKEEERRSELSYARRVPLPMSEISARQVPLPPSTVGGRGYAASVAPSDSVSSIGIKRERERLRERTSPRDRW